MSDKNIYNTEFTTEETLETVLEKLKNSEGTINVEKQSGLLIKCSEKEAKQKFQYSKKKKSSGFGGFLKRNKKLKEAQKTQQDTHSGIYIDLYQRAILDTLLQRIAEKKKEYDEKEADSKVENLELQTKISFLINLSDAIKKSIKDIDQELASNNVEEVPKHTTEEGSEAAAVLEVVKASHNKMKEDAKCKASEKSKKTKKKKGTEIVNREDEKRKITTGILNKSRREAAIAYVKEEANTYLDWEKFSKESNNTNNCCTDKDDIDLSELSNRELNSTKKKTDDETFSEEDPLKAYFNNRKSKTGKGITAPVVSQKKRKKKICLRGGKTL